MVPFSRRQDRRVSPRRDGGVRGSPAIDSRRGPWPRRPSLRTTRQRRRRLYLAVCISAIVLCVARGRVKVHPVNTGEIRAMADAALANATKQLKCIQAEIAELDQEVVRIQERRTQLVGQAAAVERFVHDWHKFASGQIAPEAAPKAPMPESRAHRPTESRRRPKNPAKEDIADQCVNIIRAEGQPMARSELYARLKERGSVLHGKDPEMVLSTMLWRMPDRVVRLPSHGYWPADTPFPEADYRPGQSRSEEGTSGGSA